MASQILCYVIIVSARDGVCAKTESPCAGTSTGIENVYEGTRAWQLAKLMGSCMICWSLGVPTCILTVTKSNEPALGSRVQGVAPRLILRPTPTSTEPQETRRNINHST